MQRTWLMLVVFGLAASLSASAQHMNLKDSPCATTVVTSDLTRCLIEANKKADARLNAVYKDIQKHLDASEIAQLKAAENYWMKYRDANCSAERDLYGAGTAKYPAYYACLEATTRARMRDLRITYEARIKT